MSVTHPDEPTFNSCDWSVERTTLDSPVTLKRDCVGSYMMHVRLYVQYIT